MLYEMLCGAPPFLANALPKLLTLHVTGQVPPLRPRAPGTPPALEQIVLRMLAKDPQARFGSMREVEQALVAQIGGLAGGAATGFWRRRRVAAVAGGLVVLVLGLVGLFGLGWARYLGWRAVGRSVATERLQALREQALGVLKHDAARASGELQLQALLRLGGSRDVTLRPVLEETLGTSQGVVQAAAAEALGQLGSRKARPALRGVLLGEPALPARVATAGALERLGDPLGHDELLRLVREGDADAQLRAAVLLCASGEGEAQSVVRARLAREELPPEIAVGLLGRLAQLGDEKARAQLGRSLLTGTLLSQLRAAEQLAGLGDGRARDLLREQAQRGGPAQLGAIRALASLGEPVDVAPLRRVIEAPASAEVPGAARIEALLGLGAGGELEDAELLGRLITQPTGPGQVPGFVQDPSVRQAAAAALVQLSARDPLILSRQALSWAQGAAGDESWLLREAAVAALSDLSELPDAAGPEVGAEAAGLLRKLFAEDRDVRVRRRAARALSLRLERSSMEALRSGLRDEAAEVREESLRALGRVAQQLAERHDSRLLSLVTGWLIEVTTAGALREQILARGALLSLGDESQREGLRAFWKSKEAALRELAIEQLGDDREQLAGLLGDESQAVQLAAARRLAELGDRRAVPVLEAARQRPGREGVLAYALLRRLGAVGEDPAELAGLLRSGDAGARLAAVEALAQLPSGLALPLLDVAARDPEALVRRMAAEVAADLPLLPEGSPALPLLRRLSSDRDAGVRVRAQVLLQRALRQQRPARPETPPTRSAKEPAPAKPSPAPEAASAPSPDPDPEEPQPSTGGGTGTLVLDADPLLPVQVDDRPWQPAARLSLALAAGAHTLRYPGGERGFEIRGGQTLKLALPLPQPAQLGKAGLDALDQKSYAKAQRLLTKALGLCTRRGKRGCGPLEVQLSFHLGRACEEQAQWAEAMSAYQRVAKATGRLHAEQRAAALEATVRLLPRVGRLLVRKPVKGRCQEVELWMPPGQQSIELEGKPRQVRMRARETVVIDACEPSGGSK